MTWFCWSMWIRSLALGLAWLNLNGIGLVGFFDFFSYSIFVMKAF